MSVPNRLESGNERRVIGTDMLLEKRQKAIALHYQPESDSAPKIVAGGEGEIAKRIIELAEQYEVPIYEQPDVVEALAKLEVGTEVPPEFYQVVAEVLAFVYSIDRKWERRST